MVIIWYQTMLALLAEIILLGNITDKPETNPVHASHKHTTRGIQLIMFNKDVPDTTAIDLVSEPVEENDDTEVYSTVKKRKKILKRLIDHQNKVSLKIMLIHDKESKTKDMIRELRSYSHEEEESRYQEALEDIVVKRERLERELRKCEKRETKMRRIIDKDTYSKESYNKGRSRNKLLDKINRVHEATQNMRDQRVFDSQLPKR